MRSRGWLHTYRLQTMDSRPHTLLTWNVNGLQARFTDLHSYVISKKPDIIALQEVGPRVLDLRGYVSHSLPHEVGGCRGLTTYVRQGLGATFFEMGVRAGIEYLTVCLRVFHETVYFINLYVHANCFQTVNLPAYVLTEKSVVMGDINARHRDLGSHLTNNVNGVRWKAFLDATDTAQLTGDNVATHVQGGRLDYVVLFNMTNGSDTTALTCLLPSLLSDHFALETSLPLHFIPIIPRKRLKVPTFRLPQLVTCVKTWYVSGKALFTDATSLYQGLLNIIEDFVCSKRSSSQRSAASHPVTYAKDPIILNCQQTLSSYQRQWQRDPSNREIRDVMVSVSRRLSELRLQARRKHWETFLGRVRQTKTLQGVWHHVNRVRGKAGRNVRDPDPVGRAQSLLATWRDSSAISGLPDQHRTHLIHNRPRRLALVTHAVSQPDDTCVPITHDELLNAVKRGQSTAPGEDGLTYDILNSLLVLQDNPILDMFNFSYTSGCLPPSWKSSILIPIPKGDGSFRPISLSSCLCKMMERIVLQRLLYKVEGSMSRNLHGFMRGRSSADCFIRCLGSSNVTCRAFIDLKGAFDRANKDVIMEELVLKGVKGRLLKWIQDYLYDRTAKVWVQGAYSTEATFELGTPQGGVLSPMLFNILMDRLARHPFPQGTEVIVYADDILLQCDAPMTLRSALEDLEGLSIQLGLVINTSKTKFQASSRICRSPSIGSAKIARTHCYKYLGAQISFKKTDQCVLYVRDLCLSRLAPLRLLANRGLGVGIPNLRMFYISVIRSLIDYAAPVLVQYSASQLKPLDYVQNEAMRIILGCPKTAKVVLMRAELGLPSVIDRVSEIACRAVGRLICSGHEPLRHALVSLRDTPHAPTKPYLRRLYDRLSSFDILDPCLGLVPICSPVWASQRVSVDIEHLSLPKAAWLPHVLQDHFMTKLSQYPHVAAVHVYCDGSVDGSKSGCGLFIRDYITPNEYTDTAVSRRLSNNISSTRAELYAMLEALHITVALRKNIYIFTDSQSALQELRSSSPADCDLVNQCHCILSNFKANGFSAHFIWVPSHVGIPLNEKADSLARAAIRESSTAPGTDYTYNYVKNLLRARVASTVSDQLNRCYHEGSLSTSHYVHVTNQCTYTYGRYSASCDRVAMRLRLGYKYFWEVGGAAPEACTLCGMSGGHSLHHYVLDCPSIISLRPPGQWDLPNMVAKLIHCNLLLPILRQCPTFAPRY